jgi:hypothetical protein
MVYFEKESVMGLGCTVVCNDEVPRAPISLFSPSGLKTEIL